MYIFGIDVSANYEIMAKCEKVVDELAGEYVILGRTVNSCDRYRNIINYC